jgi:Pentapeptide repeats (8 copies)
MTTEEHLARLRTWIAKRQVREGIRYTSQRVMARLRSTPWWELARRYQQLLMGLGALLLLLVTWKLPQWYAASWEKLTDPKDIARLESDTRSTMVQAVGGLALLAGLFFTWRNLRMTEQNSRQTLDLSRKGQINDRFIKAIEQLGAVDQGGRKKLEVRLGGIYALEQIAKDSPEDHHWPIMEILTAYVRENALWKEEEQPSQEDILPSETQPTQSNQSPPKLAPDIQAILTVLGQRTRTYRKGEDQPLNLSKSDLRGADLSKSDLRGAHLQDTHLEGAFLMDAHLEGADLEDAHLEEALLVGAHLEGAVLWDARLDGAWLMDTRLKGALFVTVKQLSTVRTLYRAELDPTLLEQIEQQYPHLLRERP